MTVIKEILLLGNPQLLKKSEPVNAGELPLARSVGDDLKDTMMDFREKYAYGRAIAAPQIGVLKQIVYMQMDQPALLINPVISDESEAMIEIWDDCMSFPDLLVRLRRHQSIRVNYRDENWDGQSIQAEDDLSELLQHEIDHLHGVLATMRAIDGRAFALRSQRKFLMGDK